MEDYKLINYSNIFLTHIVDEEKTCTFSVKNHTLIYVFSGELTINDNGTVSRFRAGDCAFIRRDHPVIMSKRCVGDGKSFVSVSLGFTRKFLLDFYNTPGSAHSFKDMPRNKAGIVKMPLRPDIASLFESLKPFYDTQFPPDESWIHLKMMEGVYAIYHTDESLYTSLFDFSEPWKIDIWEFMNENYMRDLSLSEIASYTGRSLATFKRDFKKISDESPQRWLINKRLEVAHRMLIEERDKRVTEVMEEVGFKNLSHFSRVYKEMYGYNPTSRS